MSEVLPEDTMVIADMQALDKGALKSQHQAQDCSTFTHAAKHFDRVDSMCQMIQQSNHSCEFVLLDNPKCIFISEFQHSTSFFDYLGGGGSQ